MKIMPCPLNGPRPILEFAYGGAVRTSPDPDTCSDAEWSAYVFNRAGAPGIKYEWWCHVPSGYWFIALRDTARDRVLATYPADAARGGLPPVAALQNIPAPSASPHDALTAAPAPQNTPPPVAPPQGTP